jgi:glycosyltransferase involved in cell wall biosynthesis
MSTLSIVIPSLNDAAMLRECLACVAAQTRAPDEVIVVDNGSTDDTAAVARAAGARVVTEPVRGVLRATAAGFDAASGEIIGRLDADSRPAPDWAERVEQDFRADPGLDGVTGIGDFYDCGWFWRFVGKRIYLGGYFTVIAILIGRIPLFGSNFAIRRRAWQRVRSSVHIDDPRAHDDLDISMVLEPDMVTRYDGALRVGVSARPFETFAGFGRRASWAFHGIGVNLREVGWLRRLQEAAERRRSRGRAEQGMDDVTPDPDSPGTGTASPR